MVPLVRLLMGYCNEESQQFAALSKRHFKVRRASTATFVLSRFRLSEFRAFHSDRAATDGLESAVWHVLFVFLMQPYWP
uniref:ABC transmembrane type-1 domain-containing protein n=1 Tax=Ascaris lumbricoides TaxID=6252 RepID=A0A0M3HRX0_ASCLU